MMVQCATCCGQILKVASLTYTCNCGTNSAEHIIVQGYYKRNRHFQRYVVSSDLTPCDFFLWGYIKDRVFVPLLPVSLNELKQRITTALASVDEDMLRSVWTELDYLIDMCRVTRGSHIEHLSY